MRTMKLPNVSQSMLIQANPHWERKHAARLAVYKRISSAFALLAAGAVASALLLQPYHDQASLNAFTRARASALSEFQSEFKAKLTITKDRDLINKVCNTWWFDLDTTKRKVTKP